MTKKEITEMNDTDLLSAFYLTTVRSVLESNSRGGETKKTMKEFDWIIEESIKRFGLNREVLIKNGIINS